jgi:hypothetical protein
MIEPEALASMHFEGAGAEEADEVADGAGVTVAIDGMNEVAGNPNFTRPDGQHVVEDAPNYNPNDVPNDPDLDEWFGDASAVAAQGTVTYQYSSELPYSSLPVGCTFVLEGDAPGATLVDLSKVDPAAEVSTVGGVKIATVSQSESSVITGMERAMTKLHADVISQSYGEGGGSDVLWQADDAAVQAGITVVASSGDEGFDNTFIAPADDPNVIGVGATTDLRLEAQDFGDSGWVDDNITTLSSTGTGQPFSDPSAPGKLVDLVAPGYLGEAACSPLVTSSCPTNTLTEAFGGTSQSAPFVAGAAADVIQAYSGAHGGARPSPTLVREILDGSATDIDAPGGEQGAGLVDIYAAVRAAQQAPGTTDTTASDAPGLVPSPTQLDVSGAGGSTVRGQLSVHNASPTATTVTPRLRRLGPPAQLDPTVTESVTAPPAGTAIPPQGAQAATPITFKVPPGVDRLNANLIWPDPTNSNILYYILTDPQGRMTQVSYDYGTGGPDPTVPDIQHTEVTDPMPGTWTATILWGNGRGHLQEPPNVPGTYTGPLSFQVTGQNYVTSGAGAAVKIPGHSTKLIRVPVPLAGAPGDHDMSVQLAGSNGAAGSVPVLARTFIPPKGGAFAATMGTSVGRDQGSPNSLFFINVPAGKQSMSVALSTADASPDNSYTYELFDPAGNEVVTDATPTTTLHGAGSKIPTARANLSVADPAPGRWLIVVQLNLTTSGREFTQVVNGDVTFNNSGVTVRSGLPTSSTATLPKGSTHSVQLQVTNTTGVGRTYTFSSDQPGIAPVSTYIPAGVTQLVTLQLTVSGAVGKVVSGALSVTTNSSAPHPPNQPTLAMLRYAYTVGPKAKP